MSINKKFFSHWLCYCGIAINTTDLEGRIKQVCMIWAGCHGLSPLSNVMNRFSWFVALIECDDQIAVICRLYRV